VIFALDRQYRYMAFTENHRKTMKRIWGVDISIGVSMFDYIGNAADREKAKRNFDRALSGESFTIIEDYGDLLHERRWYENSYNPIIDEQGTIIGLTLFLSDVTDRLLAEKELRESEQRYYNIIEDQTEFICRFLPDGTHVFVNEAYASYFGKKRDELVGTIFKAHIFPDDREKFRQFFSSLTPAHPVGYIEHRIIMPDGEVRWLRWSDRAIFDEGGSLIEYQSVGRDITDQKRTEDALRQANRQLNLLTSITRHDILNKVIVMRGYLGVAQEKIRDPVAGEFIRQLEFVTHAIKSQIEFTRVYQDIGTRVPQWQDLSDLVPASEVPPGITLTADVQDISVFADPMLEKVFSNLLDNSVKHGEHVTSIGVSWKRSDGGLTILWEDNGVGIPEKEKEQIFERGYGKNTGLGLFLAREILTITGMTIRETGEAGKGARFEIAVPKGAYRIGS
jgi:PAS domain S-box-containing protein